MGAPEIGYERYLGRGGALPEDSFRSLLPHARAAVDHLIGINAVTDEGAYVDAVVAAMASYAATGTGGGGIRIGGFSTYGDGGGADPHDAAMGAARRVLSTTGMLFGGIA